MEKIDIRVSSDFAVGFCVPVLSLPAQEQTKQPMEQGIVRAV